MSITYFEIGGKLVELLNEHQVLTGGQTAKETRTNRNVIREAVKLQKDVSPVILSLMESDSSVTWEDVGRLAGLTAGIAVAVSTSPLTLIDGVLPIADAAWWAANMKFTHNAQSTGARIGSYVDDHTDLTPGRIYRGVKPPSRSDVRGF